MNIEKKNVKELLPADYNPRKDLKPGDPEYEKLKRSIEQCGYVEPVIWNKATGRVVGGHQRLKVLIAMGISEGECVVVELDEKFCDVIVKRYIEQIGSTDGVSVQRDGLTYRYSEVCNESGSD